MSDFSANEIEGLVLKAARGGGLPTGLGEDLAAAAAFLNLDRLETCPCSSGAVASIPSALDLVIAGQGPQTVVADPFVIEAYIAVIEAQIGQTVIWVRTPDGGVFERLDPAVLPDPTPLGRRDIPEPLLIHLKEMGAKMLVPETDASRLAGAGAGLNDND